MKYKSLDVCCGAGGCSHGYYLSGITDITGVDLYPQPKYPYAFILGDGIEYIAKHGKEYDLIHISPPCQAYSFSTTQWRKKGYEYPDLIDKFRDAVIKTGKDYVIENVPTSPLLSPILLNGYMFNILIHRPRYFESNFPISQLPTKIVKQTLKMGRKPKEGDIVQPVGHFSGADYVRREMGIHWMAVKELSQAIPPCYTEYIGKQWLQYRSTIDG